MKLLPLSFFKPFSFYPFFRSHFPISVLNHFSRASFAISLHPSVLPFSHLVPLHSSLPCVFFFILSHPLILSPLFVLLFLSFSSDSRRTWARRTRSCILREISWKDYRTILFLRTHERGRERLRGGEEKKRGKNREKGREKMSDV